MFFSVSFALALLSELRQLVRREGLALALAGVLGGIGASASAASAATPVTCGSKITAPGSYALAANCSGPGVTITASGVTLDLAGHTMTGPGKTGPVRGVFVDDSERELARVRIVGPGTITRYSRGVALGTDHGHGVSHSTVTKLTTNDSYYGIALHGSATENTIDHNVANMDESGVYLEFRDSELNTTKDLIFSNTTDKDSYAGIEVKANDNLIAFNTAHNDGGSGIVLRSEEKRNRVQHNSTDGNHVSGIVVQGSNNLIDNKNTATKNYLSGIVLTVGAKSNGVVDNTALGNFYKDVVDFNADCDSNRWTGNTFKTASAVCIH